MALLRTAEVDVPLGNPVEPESELGWCRAVDFDGLVVRMMGRDLELQSATRADHGRSYPPITGTNNYVDDHLAHFATRVCSCVLATGREARPSREVQRPTSSMSPQMSPAVGRSRSMSTRLNTLRVLFGESFL